MMPPHLSFPPLPPDPKLADVAPEECLFYMNWAGTADPDPDSTNRTERLLSEPAVRELFDQVERQITLTFRRQVGRGAEGAIVGETVPMLVKVLLTRPAALFVTEWRIGQRDGAGPAGMDLRAGLVVNAGDQVRKVRAALTSLHRQMVDQPIPQRRIGDATVHDLPAERGAPRALWGVAGRYVFVAVGDGTAQDIVLTLDDPAADAPQWLGMLQKRLQVKRTGAVRYLDAARLLERLEPMIGFPNSDALIDALGLRGLQAVESVSGLDDTGFVNKTLLRIAGEPSGLLSTLPTEPLRPDAIAQLPGDATFAIATSFDLSAVYERLLEVLEQAFAPMRRHLAAGVQQMETQLGFRLVEDLFEHLGTTWTLHNSPSDGGLVITGLTATVQVRDREGLGRTLAQFVARLRQELGASSRPHVLLGERTYRGHRIYFLNPVRERWVVSPAWALTRKTLVVAAYPQMVMAHIDRLEDGDPAASLVALDDIAPLFAGDDAPSMITYQDMPAVFRLAYPVLHPLATLLCAELQNQGVQIDVSILPPARTIARHLRPSYSYGRRTADGLLIESRGTLPIGAGMLSPSAFVMTTAAAGPAIVKARQRARQIATMSNMRQLLVACHLYADEHDGTLPPSLQALEKIYIQSRKVFSGESGRPII